MPYGIGRKRSLLLWGYVRLTAFDRFAVMAQAKLAYVWAFFRGLLLEQCKVIIVLGHRSRQLMRSLISPLKSIINAFLNGQLVPPPQETEFLDFQ